MKKLMMLCSLLLIVMIGCQKETEKASSSTPTQTHSAAPHKCAACDGTGKVRKSEEIPLPFKMVSFKVNDHGFLNPDYYAEVTLENDGDEDGTFTVYADFNYKDIGTHTEQADLFVKAHSTASKQIHYDADKRCDDAKCRVRAPVVIHTSESICPACNGKGLIAN